MTFFLLYLPAIILPFLLLFTKLHDEKVDLGDLFFCTILAVVPVFNIIGLIFFFYVTAKRREWLGRELF